MKTILRIVVFIFSITSMTLDVFAASKHDGEGGVSTYIQFESAVVRKEPKPFSSEIATLRYRDQVAVLSKQGTFFEIQSGRVKGFVHQQALLSKEGGAPQSLGDVKVQADSARVVLASKGFVEAAEKEYRSRNSSLGTQFTLLDQAKSYTVSNSELVAFMKEGGL